MILRDTQVYSGVVRHKDDIHSFVLWLDSFSPWSTSRGMCVTHDITGLSHFSSLLTLLVNLMSLNISETCWWFMFLKLLVHLKKLEKVGNNNSSMKLCGPHCSLLFCFVLIFQLVLYLN